MTHIMVCTPVYGKIVYEEFARSMLALQKSASEKGILVSWETIGDSLISRARNRLAARFMASDATHLMWIDADEVWEPEQVWQLLDCPHRVRVAAVPFKTYDWDRVKERAAHINEVALSPYTPNMFHNPPEWDGHFFEVIYAGTGFMMVDRSALELLGENFPQLKIDTDFERHEGDWYYGVYDTEIIQCPQFGRRYLSEDFAFCERWRSVGGRIWCDYRSFVSHIGPHKFVGDFPTFNTNR